MGIRLFGRSFCNHNNDIVPAYPNPNPTNFQIKDIGVVNNYVIVKVHYPDCTNFEGDKILVFRDTTPQEIKALPILDPHFCRDDHLSPIARFIPTTEGMAMAVRFCKAMK